jgi:pSer/pThr/pTyr-binding forkhead associated (FHA) protein
MKIADISVSRVHSFIRFEGNELIIEDNGSKFGTMVRVNKPEKLLDVKFFKSPKRAMYNPFMMQDQTPINSSMFQIGRSLFYFRFENFKTQKRARKEEKRPCMTNGYSRWRGTIFNQKMKACNTVELIPSEFVSQTPMRRQ